MMGTFKENKEEWKGLFADDTVKVAKEGFDLYIPSTNTESYGCFLVDSIHGHDSVAYDSKSIHAYYVLEGSGSFVVMGEKFPIRAGEFIMIGPNNIFYYKGTMKMVEEITPNFDEKNFHVVENVVYNEKGEGNIKK